MIMGLLALAPVRKYQKAYINMYRNVQAKPQKHLDANYKYADFVEDGGDVKVANKLFKKWANEPVIDVRLRWNNLNNPNKQKIRKPYYIRDKYNPNILHPYRG